MAAPVFDYIPIIQDTGKVFLRAIVVTGYSTKVGDESSLDGRLYCRITPGIGIYTVEVFEDSSFDVDGLLMSGEIESTGSWFNLDEQNTSGLTGRAILGEGSNEVSESVAIVTFATDSDIMSKAGEISAFPGYDSEYGLAYFHAQAMRILLTSFLPQAIPHLFIGKNLSAFLPLTSVLSLPDITKIRNPAALERVQADLVKELSATQREYLDEWAAMATGARGRIKEYLASIKEENPAPPIDPTTLPPNAGVLTNFSSFSRG
jgi:hypothetical protein